MGWMRSLGKGSKALADKHARNAEIDEELEAFIGESVNEKMRAGMSLNDAIKAARAEVGSAETRARESLERGLGVHAGPPVG